MNLGVQGTCWWALTDPRQLQSVKFMNSWWISSLDLDATATSLKSLGKHSYFIWEKEIFGELQVQGLKGKEIPSY